MKRTILLLSGLLLVSASAFSQSLSVGIKGGYVTYHRTYAPPISIQGTQIYKPVNSTSFRDGWRFAAFSDLSAGRLLARAELAYAYNIGGDDFIEINNWNNPSNENPADNWAMGKSTSFQNWELSLTAGYRLYKWLTVMAGPGVWYQQLQDPKKLKQVDDQHGGISQHYDRNFNKRNKFEYAIQESYVPLVVTAKLELEAEVKRFLFSLAYDRSLSPVGKYLEYEGGQYFFRQTADRYVVSIGYRWPSKTSFNKGQ